MKYTLKIKMQFCDHKHTKIHVNEMKINLNLLKILDCLYELSIMHGSYIMYR